MAGNISLKLIVDDKGSAVVEKMTRKSEGAFGRLIQKTLSWKNALVGLAGAAGLGLVIKKVIDLASAQELVEKKLEAAMRSTGRYNVNLMNSFKSYASALQDTTAIGDESILGVMAMLQTFKLEEDVLKDATKATLDLAKATGQDLMSAAILVGKAAVGETGMLSRYGIIIDEAALKARGFQAVLEEINLEFGGQAQAQAETFSGKIEKIKGSFGDMLEKVGDIIIKNPVILNALDLLAEKFKGWGDLLAQNKDAIIAWASETAQIIIGWIDAIWMKLQPVWQAIKEFPAKMKAAGGLQGVMMGNVLASSGIDTGAPINSAFESTAAGGSSSADIQSIIAAMQQGKTISGGGTNIIISEKMSRSDVNNIVSEANRSNYRGASGEW